MARVTGERKIPENVVSLVCVACDAGRMGKPFKLSDGDTEITINVCGPCQQRFREADSISSEDIYKMLCRLMDTGVISEFTWDLEEAEPGK